ncbi:MAG: glycosyltransferase [Phycisphaerales bacterium]|nr:glycosyltransferase [Phycisphaerales bacterium]
MLTWVGPFEGSGAYPTINRQLAAAVERAGHTVLRNVHNDGLAITPLSITHTYPLRPPNVRHARNVGLAVWEFTGPLGVPRSFAEAFRGFDLIGAPSEWVCEQFRAVTETPVARVQWGFDPQEFTPDGPRERLPVEARKAAHVLLWVGGTDARHGLDLAMRVMDRLPADYHLVAKTSADYPPALDTHPRVTIIRADVVSLAPWYRAADALLHTARGVGFSLPVLEALASGCPVASSDLPPVREFAPVGRVAWAGGEWQRAGQHHVHRDCLPWWFEPDIDALADAAQQAVQLGRGIDDGWRARWTWDAAAVRLLDVLKEDKVAV